VYAILLGFSLSTIIKAFTGRTSPPHRHRGEELVLIDNSNGFDFGFMNHQVIGGWPSSHATIAFALAVTLSLVLPRRWYIQAVLFGIALFIGIGVTFGFH
jgi:membrane-associated phospholipid phosphatase